MASRNGYYRDPALAQAFNNIASMFGPPSGADAAGFATANAKRAEAARLAELFNYAKDPNFDREAFERRAIAGGLYNPTQSYYKVDQENLTTQRGQDVSATTSIANNAADNQRALATNRLDNQRAGIVGLFGPLNPGQVRPEVPAEVSGVLGLPGLAPTAGAPKPLSETEAKGQERVELRRNGVLTDQVLLDTILGEKAPVTAIGPDGKTPVYVAPGTAARMQMPAAAAPGSAPVKRSEGTAIINGRQVAVTRAPDSLRWETQDGQPVPDDARVMDMPKATGSNDQLGLPTTANSTAANNQAAEVTRALSILDIYEELINRNPGAIGLVGAIRGTAQNLGASVGDLAKSFGARAPQIGEAAAALQEGMKGVAPNLFDPSIPEADFLQGTLAYALARTENPSGEVSRQAYERALERVRGGGLLANSEAARAAIAANRKVLNTQLQGIQTLRGQQPARNDAGYTAPPAPPAAMPQPGARLRFDANGNPVQ